MSERPNVSPEKAKEMQDRIKERNLLLKEIKSKGSMTVSELSKATGIEKRKLFKHMIAMTQFGKVSVIGQRDDQPVYSLTEGGKQ